MTELKKSVESLKKANEDMTVEVNKLKLSHEDTVPWNIRAQNSEILVEWKDKDKIFITTRGATHVLKCIKENSSVTIIASSGVGKMATLRHVALQMGKEGYDLLLVTDPRDIVKFYNQFRKRYNMCLSKVEKESIAEVYLKEKAPEIKDFYHLYVCFPLLCKLYYENPAHTIIDFFQNPFTVYEADIDKLQKKGFFGKYCALALCVMFNNNLKEEILTEGMNEETKTIIENTCEACKLHRGTSRLTLQDELNSFIHTFLKKEQNIYRTINDKMFDFLVYYFGRKIITCMIKYAHSSFIKERFLLGKLDNVDQFKTVVFPDNHEMYIQRMIDDWSKGKVDDVFSNINMNISQFRQTFLCCLNKLDVTYHKQLALTCDCRSNETTPLKLAAQECLTEIVRMLLDKGADYNTCENNGVSSVMCACRYGHTEIVGMLLDIGADYNTCENNCVSSVIVACRYGHTEIVRMLLDKGADYNTCENKDKGANYDTCNNDGWSPVLSACRYGHIEIVRMLLNKGADYDICNNDVWSPVLIACSYGHTEIVRMLLDKGAVFNKRNSNGLSPVILSCIREHAESTEIVKMLLDKGAEYNTRSSGG
ncbi:unnamed protein product [Mytilus coruscus]|uniref:Novel STAND NTPase 3 domain-containing protein n=1 Tax=Mytilus coruscus TaxID=42192 RepID=A0A6J8BN87_MYTCO|nr:unnamed protein product [Mytilus coruscus]